MRKQLVATLLLVAIVVSGGIAFCEDPSRCEVDQLVATFNKQGLFESDEFDQIASVPRDRALEFRVLWDQECLFNYPFFGLRFGTEQSHTIKFYYGSPHRFAALKRETVTAMAELPFRDGKLHGKVRRWTPEGELLLEVPYVDGKIDGKCRFFSNSGKLLGTSTLINGTGIYRVWHAAHEEPMVIREIKYVDGEVVPQ